jgi:hypothetical protein
VNTAMNLRAPWHFGKFLSGWETGCLSRRTQLHGVSELVSRAIAHTVSSRFPTSAARVRAQVRSYGVCGRRSGTGAGFLLVLRLPLSTLIPPTAPHSSSSIQVGYDRPVSGRLTKWTQSHRTPKN